MRGLRAIVFRRLSSIVPCCWRVGESVGPARDSKRAPARYENAGMTRRDAPDYCVPVAGLCGLAKPGYCLRGVGPGRAIVCAPRPAERHGTQPAARTRGRDATDVPERGVLSVRGYDLTRAGLANRQLWWGW